ncbi:MAG: isoprenylcysteine carboxylmethyltransferase family protein [Candidatus Pacebacteria bacterium]|nr:isoprenylcysteine carboxylmethyltransferase family protein [Candidatus Paceibacterota bacterium]
MNIYSEIIAASWGVFLLVWFVGAHGVKHTATDTYTWRRVAIRIAGLLLIVLLFSLPVINSYFRLNIMVRQISPLSGNIGVALSIIGVGIAIWARIYLGRNWGAPRSLHEGHELVTSGPYRYVRHPIYTGVLLALLGAAVVQGPVWFIPFAYFVFYFIRSIRIEEGHMLERFPSEYPVYRARTKRLVPFIY